MASTQDIETWRGRMNKRNADKTGPMIVTPVIQRLIDVGAIAPPDKPEEGMEEGTFDTCFPDLNAPTDENQTDQAAKMTEAISKYVQSGAAELIPEKEFLTKVLHFDPDEADAILEAADKRIEEEEEAQQELERKLTERVAGDPSLRVSPPEGTERIPDPAELGQQPPRRLQGAE